LKNFFSSSKKNRRIFFQKKFQHKIHERYKNF